MKLKGRRIGFGITGSHCTFETIIPEIEKLIAEGAQVIPVVTAAVINTDTRFGTAASWIEKIEEVTGKKVIDTIAKAEGLGPKNPLDRKNLNHTINPR